MRTDRIIRAPHRRIRALPHPRLGFFGVIDERFDPVAVSLLADAHPEWQVVLVGPVVKIDAATLPRLLQARSTVTAEPARTGRGARTALSN